MAGAEAGPTILLDIGLQGEPFKDQWVLPFFPDTFDYIPLGGTKARPEPHPANRLGAIHIGFVDDGGEWGTRLMAFMRGRVVKEIYLENGFTVR